MAVGDELFYIDATTLITLIATEAITGDAVTGATVTADLVDMAGDTVAAGLAGVERAAEAGTYDLSIPSSTSMTEGSRYSLVCTIAGTTTDVVRLERRAGRYQR